MSVRISTLTAILIITGAVHAEPAGLTADERAQIDKDIAELGKRIGAIHEEAERRPAFRKDRFCPDAEIFRKAVIWTLRYEPKLEPADVALIHKALKRCRERVAAIEANKVTWWPDRKGKVVRGFVSSVDGSVQPYGVVVPRRYTPELFALEDRKKYMRLDVVLHGSTKPTGIAELRFLFRFDEGDGPSASVPDEDFIEVHPFGRCENCYRWAGETDVFEAIGRVEGDYAVDWKRVVLRGMSMGASGTWHLGLKHPDQFVALGPYCGYVDTHEFSKTPIPNFVRVGPLPPYQETALHTLDSVDYAANAATVPVVACMGEKDPFFQAHVLMGKAMEKEGLKLTNLISPGTGHVIDPATHREQMRRIAEIVARGQPEVPKHVRFVTWSPRYRRCFWLTIETVAEHYKRTELDATIRDDGTVEIQEPVNVTRFTIYSDALRGSSKLRIGKTEFPISPRLARGDQTFRKEGAKWVWRNPPRLDDTGELPRGAVSEPNPSWGWQMLGPIDDAFRGSFLCVRGTAKPWNPAIQAWADASLKRFADEWARYFRGDLPVKDDKDVTDKDMAEHNLILFGDPGSNSLIARALSKLPITWTREELRFGDQKYPAASHAPILIHPNPLVPDGGFVVLNSGHTFHAKELSTLNYLLFPRLGEGAVMKIGDPPADLTKEQPVRAGFFDENWRFKSE